MHAVNAPAAVCAVLHRLHQSGFLAYAVGGAVRDALLGLTPSDWDITTSATPAEIETVFADCKQIEVGKKHGVVLVLWDNIPFEITTFRADGIYKDARHPESISFSKTLKEDVIRRDFTVNTLCWNAEEGLIDLCGGVADLQNGVLRAVGDADKRFQEDALRILRCLRFSAVLGFQIEEKTAAAMLKNKGLLSKISMERITNEFIRLLCGNYEKQVLLQFYSVIAECIPELLPLIHCAQETPYHCFDVFEHTLVAIENIPPVPYLRLTMFFHDFGKPQCKKIDENGQAHFKGHQKAGAELIEPILRRMRLDRKTINRVTFLVSIHDLKAPRNKIEAKILLSKIGQEAYVDLIKIKRADNRAKAKPHAIDQKLAVMQELLDEILAKQECFTLQDLKINGNDLKPLMQGQEVKMKEVLLFLLDAVVREQVENQKVALLDYFQTHFQF